MASLLPFALQWWCWCTVLWILKHHSASKWRLLHHFVSLGLSLTQTGWLFSKCTLCILSHQGSAPLSPHLEDCLRLVSNSSSQSLTPLGLRCPWMEWRTQWQKPYGKVFIASFSGSKRLITKDWISCKVHSHKEGQDNRLSHLIHLHTSSHLKVMLYNTFMCFPMEFWANIHGRSLPYMLSVGITTMKELGPCVNVGPEPLNNLWLEYKSWDGMQ